MKKKSDHTMLFIFISIAIVLSGIVITSLINSSKTEGEDIRARASTSNGLTYFATVSETNRDMNAIVVTSLMPHNNDKVNFGTWIVTPPGGFNFSDFTVGTKVALKVDPKTFLIDKHTLVAKEITKR